MQSRLDILKIHSRKMNLMRGIDLKKIAEKMGGASGAELKVATNLQYLGFISGSNTKEAARGFCIMLFKILAVRLY